MEVAVDSVALTSFYRHNMRIRVEVAVDSVALTFFYGYSMRISCGGCGRLSGIGVFLSVQHEDKRGCGGFR